MKIADVEYDIVIEAGRAEKNYLHDLWRFRDLFYILAWRDVKVRYKQTAIGLAWSVIRPLLSMLVLTIIFGGVADLPSQGRAPYAVMVYAAMLPWLFFSNALAESSGSLVGNANLISKIYFPRMIVPTSSIIVSLVDFFISLILFALLLIWYQFIPSWQIVFLPLFLVMAVAAALGTGLLITAMNVKYRDFRYIIPFIIQFGMYVSPVGFSTEVVPDKWKNIFYLNPLAGVIDGFRWSVIGGNQLYVPGFLISTAVILLFIFVGVWYFRNTERKFADII